MASRRLREAQRAAVAAPSRLTAGPAMRLVLATRNAHKVRELGPLLAPHELVPLPAEVELPPEDGSTFAENALVKARAAAAATASPAVADDSGIEAAALGGRPASARRASPANDATDEENLAKLLREVPAGGDTRVAYVCVLAFAGPAAEELVAEGRCEGRLAHDPRGDGGFGYDPAFVPDEPRRRAHDGRADAGGEGRDQPPRPRGACARAAAGRPGGGAVIGPARAVGPAAQAPSKVAAARLSIVSNSILIVLKVVAGAITGSIAIITEAAHSAIDLVAAIVAYFGVRKADEPADEDHPYGHAKIENLAAAIEGMLILVGAGMIIFEAVRRLVDTRARSSRSGSASR